MSPNYLPSPKRFVQAGELITPNYDELVKSHIPYVVHASTSSAQTEYQ
jgi:hypothetical protein